MPEYKIKKLFNEEFSHLISFCFSFSLRIDIDIFSYWINIRQLIWTDILHFFVYLLEYTEVYLYFLIYTFNLTLPNLTIRQFVLTIFSGFYPKLFQKSLFLLWDWLSFGYYFFWFSLFKQDIFRYPSLFHKL